MLVPLKRKRSRGTNQTPKLGEPDYEDGMLFTAGAGGGFILLYVGNILEDRA